MTPIPMKERFWKRKLEKGRSRFPVSATLARRVFYAGCFVYLSFLAHGFVIYRDQNEPEPAAVARAQAPLERGLLEPLLERALRARRGE